ncbi:peptide methionine sulfoxide reductase-like [Diadema antillarum]|uniref:peptide methionine sulfoxide reductase-like n=1 Tax=Diadema antillarum TaxID=105358 RepID=UPI003A8C343C
MCTGHVFYSMLDLSQPPNGNMECTSGAGSRISAIMYVTCILLVSVSMATGAAGNAGCGDDVDNFLKYKTFERSEVPYKEPLGLTLKATFGMGCFWGVEASFGALPGVVRVKAGYTGGTLPNPNYRMLGDHTEAVEIEFDPSQTNFAQLLKTFWSDHDPTELNKAQYMSAIFYQDKVQHHQAEGSLQKEQTRRGESSKIATKILPAGKFYDAEDYHQKYFLRQHHALVESLELKDADFLSSSRTSRLLGYMSGSGDIEAFNTEVESLALSASQADFMRLLIQNKDGGTCH